MSYKRLIPLLALFFAGPVFAQNNLVPIPATFLGPAGSPRLGANLTITFCTSTATGVPCSPLAQAYADSTNSNPINQGINPLKTDALGNAVAFYAAPGQYSYTITGPGLASPQGPYQIFISCIPGVTCAALNTNNTFTGDSFFKSGRPWFDVMAFGAVNDGVTNDAAAIQSAITAACAKNAGIVYFPPAATGTTRYFVNTTITVPCDNLTFQGATGHAVANGPPNPSSYIVATSLNAPVFQTTGGSRNGLVFKNLGILGAVGNTSEIGIQGVNVSGMVIRDMFIAFMGGPCVQVVAGTNSGKIENSFFTSCINGNSSADTGAIDINQADWDVLDTYVDCGITGTGLIGTGHTYGILMKSSSGTSHIVNSRADLCQHGIGIVSSRNIISLNRAFHNQGNGMMVSGTDNIITSNDMLGNSQTASGNSSAFKITGSSNSIADNYIDAAGGDTNLQLNGFDDTNSSGSGADGSGNFYSNNRIGLSAITGSLYNLTGTATYRVSLPTRNASPGDASVTVIPGVDAEVQYFNVALTANRTVTLSATGAWNGARFRIVRGALATGASTLTVSGKVLSAAGQWVDFEYIGGWLESASGSF